MDSKKKRTDSPAKKRTDTPAKKRKSNDASSKAKPAKFQKQSDAKRPLKPSKPLDRKNATTADKENFTSLVETGKRVWNALRLKTNTAAQTQELVLELIPLVTGRAHALSLRHDASRVVQAALQFGSVEQRRSIVTELTSSTTSNGHSGWLELCQSQYAHFVVLKVLTYCHADTECRSQLNKAFKGHVAKLAVHATASKVMEALFLLVSQQKPQKQKAPAAATTGAAVDGSNLFLELYGPHVTLFGTNFSPKEESTKPQAKSSRLTLADHLERLPEKKDIVIEFVRNLVHKGMEKQLYGFTYFQELLLEYCLVVPSTEIRALAATGADAAIHLLSAKAGTRVAALWIAYGTAKERKRILRSWKGYSRSGLLHRQAYLAILRLVQLTDDTVSIHKNLFAELVKAPEAASTNDSPLLEIALSDTGSKLLLLVLIDEVTNPEGYQKLLDPYEHVVLFPNPTVLEQGIAVPTSRKDPTVRRSELVQYLREPLVDVCRLHASALLRSIPGSSVLKEVYASLDRPASVVQALLDACIAALEPRDTAPDEPFLFEDVTAHRALKSLVMVDAARKDETSESLASELVKQLTAEQWMAIANSNRGAFVVAAVAQIDALRPRLVAKLQVPELQRRQSTASGSTAGWEALLKVIS